MALRPTQFQPGLDSGSRARRAGTARVPMCCFQASALAERPRWASKPTPRWLLGGGSTVIVVIRFTAPDRMFIQRPDSREPGFFVNEKTCALPVREYLGRERVRIGLSYYRRVFANVLASARSHAFSYGNEPAEAKFVAGRVSQQTSRIPHSSGAGMS